MDHIGLAITKLLVVLVLLVVTPGKLLIIIHLSDQFENNINSLYVFQFDIIQSMISFTSIIGRNNRIKINGDEEAHWSNGVQE